MKQIIYVLFVLFFSLNLTGQIQNEQWEKWEDNSLHDTVRLKAFSLYIWDNYLFTQPDSAFILAQHCYKEAEQLGYPKYMGNSLNVSGIAHTLLSNYDESEKWYLKAIELYEQEKMEANIANIYTNLSTLKRDLEEWEEAKNYLNKSLEIRKRLKDNSAMADILIGMATICRKEKKYKEAIQHLEQAIAYDEIGKDSAGLATAFTNMGIMYHDRYYYEKAISYSLKAVDIAESINDKPKLAAVLNIIGNIYDDIEDFDKAIAYHSRTISIYEELGSKQSALQTMSNLGSVHTKSKNHDEAIKILNKGLKLAKELDYKRGILVISMVIGNNYSHKGDYEKANEFINESLKISIALEDKNNMARAMGSLGSVQVELGNYRKAINLGEKSLEISKEVNNVELTQTVTQNLVEIYLKTSGFSEGIEVFKSYQASIDSLNNKENERAVLRSEYKHDYEKQAVSDSLAFAQKEAIAIAQIKTQRFGLVALIATLLLLAALAYSIFKSRQRAQAEAQRVTELDAFKSQFYTNITHEFRTSLTVILGMTQQIKEQPKKYLKEGLQLIERNGKNLLTQINQILDLSKLETKSFKLNYIQNDVIAFLRYTTNAFQSYANGQNLSLRFFTPIEELEMAYDPDYLQKIMQNLISNALKHTPSDGEVKVYLNQSNDHVEIKVKDTGVGISEKDLPHIFDRFYQVDNSESSGGTGIGLAYVKELVRVMNGEISVESEVGKGSSFLVRLPFAPPANPFSPREKPAQPKGELPRAESQNKHFNFETKKPIPTAATEGVVSPLGVGGAGDDAPTLLLIEDNPDVVTYLKTCLDDQYQIDIAYNGRIGIEKALETIPDIIISDVMMPEVGGYEVCDKLKNDERTSHIPIIMLTAKADLDSKIAGLKRGADAYLSKPFDKEELLIRLKGMVEKQKNLTAYFSKKFQNGNGENGIETIPNEEVKIENEFILKVRKVVEENYSDEHFALPNLCQKIGMSRSQLFRKMKALINESPSAFIRNYRLNKGHELLQNSDMNVSEVAWEVGFKDVAHFSKSFQEKFKMLPSATNK